MTTEVTNPLPLEDLVWCEKEVKRINCDPDRRAKIVPTFRKENGKKVPCRKIVDDSEPIRNDENRIIGWMPTDNE